MNIEQRIARLENRVSNKRSLGEGRSEFDAGDWALKSIIKRIEEMKYHVKKEIQSINTDYSLNNKKFFISKNEEILDILDSMKEEAESNLY